MSIRRISDLPRTIIDQTNESTMAAFKNSAMEISYCTNYPTCSTFLSKQVTINDFSDYLYSVFNNNGIYVGAKTFKDWVNFENGINISGHVKVVKRFGSGQDNTLCADFSTITLNSDNDATLSAKYLKLYTNGCIVNASSLATNVVGTASFNAATFQATGNTTATIASQNVQLSTSATGAIYVKKGNETLLQTNSTGNFVFSKTINGTALKAQWADLAEYYETDKQYEPGTLVKFGGEKELTIADNEANAVVTTNPGLILNSKKENSVGIALVGRVPVKVVGKIRKFDNLQLSEIPGIACKNDGNHKTIAKALQASDDDQIKLVECVVKLDF